MINSEYICIDNCMTNVICLGCDGETKLGETVYMQISPIAGYFHKGCLPTERKTVRLEPGAIAKIEVAGV